MNRTLFVVSDVHGFYTAMKSALDTAGFDPQNPNHWFVSAGDLFDRGTENRQVYNFVRNLPQKLLIRGNHEDRLDEILTVHRIESYDERNCTTDTIQEFFGENVINENGRVWILSADLFLQELREFLDSMTDYYENDAYVITHGWIPFNNRTKTPKMIENWRELEREVWKSARWQG